MPEHEEEKASSGSNGAVRRMNNTQRKELARIIERQYEARIGDADTTDREAFEERRKKAIQQVKQELGVDVIEKQLRDLEQKRKDLGFTHAYSETPDNGSRAKTRYDEILRKQAQEKNTLRLERDGKVAQIWTVETVEEAQSLVGVETQAQVVAAS